MTYKDTKQKMKNSHIRKTFGFTLVELSIVMIIIGLLIGGTFGGMKLVENMQVNKTVQDLKAIDSAALTFKDTYGRLPGDLRNPSTRLPNCTTAPCSTTGDGDRIIDPPNSTTAWSAAQDATYERFTFWSHLQAADLLAMGTKNTTVLDFDEGQPSAPVGGGYRITEFTNNGWYCGNNYRNGIIMTSNDASSSMASASTYGVPCEMARSIDTKIDDGISLGGKYVAANCSTVSACATSYDRFGVNTYTWYDAAF